MGENNMPGEHRPAKRATLPAVVVPLLGFAAVMAGCLVAYLNRNITGWFSFAALGNQPFTADGGAFVTHGTQLGLGLAAAGLLVLAFWAGMVVGRRPGSGAR